MLLTANLLNRQPFPFKVDTIAKSFFADLSPASNWQPAVDIRENDDAYLIYADVPGVAAEDIEVTFNEGVLSLRGERTGAPEATERQLYRNTERRTGAFERTIALPESVDPDRITATGKDGVLTVTIKKREALQPRRIEVRA